jgi:DNA-binding MarR family transcriptional regulator
MSEARSDAFDSAEVANELRPVLLRVARELRRESHAFGLTATQVSLLAAIRERPGVGIRQLADFEGVTAPHVSVQVRRLERAGLVRRSEVADGRRIGLHVTPEAMRALQSVRSRRTAWLSARIDNLPASDRAALAAAVEPMSRLLGPA